MDKNVRMKFLAEFKKPKKPIGALMFKKFQNFDQMK